MNSVRFGVIGLGNMGSYHCAYMHELQSASLNAVCDIDHTKLATIGEKYGVRQFNTDREMIDSGEVDAVIVAVPHYLHAEMTIAALERGLHVITEKPEAVSVKAAAAINDAAAKHPKQKFGIMFQSRTSPINCCASG